MQLLSCDLWLMERKIVRSLAALVANIGAIAKLPEPKTEGVLIEQVAASAAAAKRPKMIASIPVSGALECRPTEMGAWLGMSSYEVIGKVFDHFMADDSISGIILDVSSPGGMVYGAPELANKIFDSRGKKPIVAIANPLMASGAYWIAAAADHIVATKSADVGSVGVIVEHVDMSKAYEKQGATVTEIKSAVSPYKGEFSDAGPLTEEARQNLQSRTDEIAANFVGDLSRFRGVSAAHVAEHFGQGRVVNAKSAIGKGMADKVMTFDAIVGRMAAGRVPMRSERALMDDVELTAERERIRENLRERAKSIMAVAEQEIGDAHA